ncbi:MAG: hypothetical protein OMM_10640, partial [Candidatus Magnetoglobus multicellularis str. Araruama]
MQTTDRDYLPNGLIALDKTVYLIDHYGVRVIDVTAPSTPRLLTTIECRPHKIYLQEGLVYVNCEDEVKIIDISNPSHPIIKDTITIQGSYNSKVIGSIAYCLFDRPGIFKVIDIREKTKPEILGSVHLNCFFPSDLYIYEDKAYITTGNNLTIIDIHDLSNPDLIGAIYTPYTSQGIFVNKHVAYIACDTSFQIIDVSRLSFQKNALNAFNKIFASDVEVVNDKAYVTSWEDGFSILDISTPDYYTTACLNDIQANAVSVSGATAYALYANCFKVIDIHNDYSPTLVRSIDCNGSLEKMVISGNTAYIAGGWNGGLKIYDLSNPFMPGLIGSVDNIWVNDIDVIDTNAYVSCAYNGIKIIDISKPNEPEIINSFNFETFNNRTESIAISKNIAVVVGDKVQLQILDISDFSQIQVIASLESISYATDVILRNNIAYILTEQNIYAVDISIPSIPVIIGTVRKSGYGRNFKIVDDIAYIADYYSGLVTLPLPSEIQSKNFIDETTLSINLPTPKVDGTYILRVFDDNENYDETFIHIHQKIEKKLTIEVIENQTTNEDISISLTFYTHNVESESENITITVTPTQPELIQNISINSISKYTHTMLIIPAEDAFGSTELDITVSDSVSTISRSLTVDVLPVNDPPMFSSSTVPVIYEDYGEKYITWADYISPGPANESDQTCTFIVHPAANALLTSLPKISQNGILNFTTAPNAYGSVVFDVSLKDDGGTENNGIDTSSIQKFTIVVEPVNDCPIFMKGEDQIVHNRDGIQTIPGWASGINQGENESNQTLQFIIETDNNSIFETIPEISNNGTLTYTPAPDQTGASLITVYLQDSGGTEFSGCDISTAQFFTITVLQTFYELTILQEGQGKIKLNDREVLPKFIESYHADETITLKAIPFENWKFAYWSGDIEDSSEDIQIVLDRPITIVAHFYEPPVTLNLIGKKQIKINGTIHDLPCSKQINKHTTVYLEPVPVSDFLKWSGDINSTETNVTVIMENDTHIAVHYKDPFEWDTIIHAESQNLGGKYQDNITVGVSITRYTEPYLSSNYFSCAMSIY